MILFKQYKNNFSIYFKKLIYKRIDFYHLVDLLKLNNIKIYFLET